MRSHFSITNVWHVFNVYSNNNWTKLFFSQGLLLRAWIDITSGKESNVKKSIKMFDEVLGGSVLALCCFNQSFFVLTQNKKYNLQMKISKLKIRVLAAWKLTIGIRG